MSIQYFQLVISPLCACLLLIHGTMSFTKSQVYFSQNGFVFFQFFDFIVYSMAWLNHKSQSVSVIEYYKDWL